MANGTYTLIVVPHTKARFRKIQFSVRLAKWACGTAAAVAVILTGTLVHYVRIAAEVHELRQLRAENKVLEVKTREYEQNAGRLQAKVENLQKMVMKLGVMAGLERSLPDSQVGGVGGATSLESIAPSRERPSLGEMEVSVNALTSRSSQLEGFYADRNVLLASTPSIWPVRGYLSAGFGNRMDPFTGQRDFHTGVDISTPIGTKIHAPADGVVVSCATKGGYGNTMIIDHGYGVVTRYGHLDGFNAKPGQRIRRGDVIAFVGDTGRSTGPHLHYEVWVRDQAQNPIHYILDEYRTFG
jgi:murein DD-endopeptidase MepM/ murein hydrolase activator NlpD